MLPEELSHACQSSASPITPTRTVTTTRHSPCTWRGSPAPPTPPAWTPSGSPTTCCSRRRPAITGPRAAEAYSMLGFLAAHSSPPPRRMVNARTFRPPTLLVKAATTLDVLSGGRAWLGLGAGYHEEEATRWASPCRPPAERFERLGETLRMAARRCGRTQRARSSAGHFRLERPIAGRCRSPGPRLPCSSAARASGTPCRLVAVRRRLQPVRHPRRRPDHPAQARRPRSPLRGRRSALRRDREDHQHAPGAGEPRRTSPSAARPGRARASTTRSCSPPVRGRRRRSPRSPPLSPTCASWHLRRQACAPRSRRPSTRARRSCGSALPAATRRPCRCPDRRRC